MFEIRAEIRVGTVGNMATRALKRIHSWLVPRGLTRQGLPALFHITTPPGAVGNTWTLQPVLQECYNCGRIGLVFTTHTRNTSRIMGYQEPQGSFGVWLRRRRETLDLTRAQLARQVACSAATLRKLEAEER